MAGVRQFDEDTMLEDALALFWSQGVAATSMVDLANATGVQRGSLYNAYGDREAIFLRAYDRYAGRFLASARASLEGDDAGQMLRRFFEAVITSMFAGETARGCLTTRTAGDGSLARQPIRARIRQMLDDLTAIVTEALARPGVREQLGLEPARAAELVVTFTRGLAVMERVYGDRAALLRGANSLISAIAPHAKRA
ncbi:TetR/AcrR family transcriptional regulator [Camelimonas lactis]|uniref:TetR family transcriptional regulator n=1 Tax=Camelimonas lactis TaxID=659006 RepID=A0A4R2GYZ7_9HYPH|nr:TetR family transcriptional regulator [Camelimonas lactis]TCO15082.1 TetR family transcriptional regulator [Camelimonas lactis]